MGKKKAERGQTETQHTSHITWTDKSLKTEGPKILLNYIYYFKTVIICGPIEKLRNFGTYEYNIQAKLTINPF